MPRNAVTYDDDFYAWTAEQAQLLRSGQFSSARCRERGGGAGEHGTQHQARVEEPTGDPADASLEVAISAGLAIAKLVGTIREQRRQISDLIDELPSLRPSVAQDLSHVYGLATIKAVAETGFPEAIFPAECPFTPEQILAEDFLPEG